LSALNAPAAGSVHVGDSFRFDVEGSRRAGMRAVWLQHPHAPAPDGVPADLTLTTLAGAAPRLLALLRS
jgi:FMN phosphatase YigB (HAD superfamily)